MANLQLPVASKQVPTALVLAALFLVAFIPRALYLDAYVAPDEGKWIYRSAHFLQAILTGDLAQTTSIAATPEVEVLAPAVPTMWSGAVGLVAKYWVEGAYRQASLPEYLLAAIPGDTEKIPLDFYPWTRWPTVLLTSLTIPIFYWLLARLADRRVAGLAAFLLALDPFFIGLSRLIHHDALVTVFIALSLLALLVYGQDRSQRRWLILSGLAGGLALLTKPTALYLAIFVCLFLLWESRKRPNARNLASPSIVSVGRGFIPAMLWWGLTALLAFSLCWPALWAAPLETLTALLDRAATAAAGQNDYALIPAAGAPLPELGFLFYPVNWLFKATLPALAGLLALLIVWRRNQPAEAILAGQTAWTINWLALFILLFLALLIPADTRDVRYFLPAVPALYALAATGLVAVAASGLVRYWIGGVCLIIQLALVIIYYPYYVDYLNPAAGGPWLAPRLVKIGSGEGLDQMGRYLSQKPNAADLTVSTSFWESFVPFFPGRYTKPHYAEEADYILIYLRQIQNRNPFPEYWSYFSARKPEYKVTLVGLDYAWLYPGPQLRVVRKADFGHGLMLQGYRLVQWAAEPGQPADLTLVWAGVTAELAGQTATVELTDETGQLWAKNSGPVLSPAGPSKVEGHYLLEIPVDAPRGNYRLRVSVQAVSHDVGSIPVRQLEPPAVQLPAVINFGNLMIFGGADISHFGTVTPDQPLKIKLVWQANQPMSRSYTTFVHVVDADGQMWGQVDRIPGDDAWPTNTWDKGEWIIDIFHLTLNPDTPPGDYTLLVGVYDSQTLERLPVTAQDDDQTVVEITQITVSVD